MRYLPDDNLSYPVLIEIGESSGSGFYFRTSKKIFVVTALHVLYKTENNNKFLRDTNLKLTSYDSDQNVTNPIELSVDLTKVQIRKNDIKDIVLVEIATIPVVPVDKSYQFNFLDGVKKLSKGKINIIIVPPHYLKKFNDVLISNEVIIIGYPRSLGVPGLQQIEAKKPLLRKGIVAGKNMLNATIILDCPVYFGNSGGLAIEVEKTTEMTKFRVIGVISQFIPFVEQLKSIQLGYTNLNFENSGYSVIVPIDTIIELTRETPESIPTKKET